MAVARSRTRLSTALVDADAASAGNVFATDTVLMNPNNPDIHGRETIEARFRGIKKGVIRVLSFTPVEIVMCGDGAHDLSMLEEEIAPPEKPPIHDRGRSMFIWQRDPDGTGRIHHMLVNGALPQGQGVH